MCRQATAADEPGLTADYIQRNDENKLTSALKEKCTHCFHM
jgi:hypothetical protein